MARENAPLDGGLYGGPDHVNEGSTSFFRLLESDEKNLLPIEIKYIAPHNDSHEGAFFSFRASKIQSRTAQALLIASVKDPDFVVLLPCWYIPKIRNGKPDTGDRQPIDAQNIRPLWTLYPLPAFPAEYTPFLLPVTRLGKALYNMRAFAIGETETW